MIASTITFNGQVGIGSILTFLTAVVGFFTVYVQLKAGRKHVERVESKVDAVNQAVNGIDPDSGQQPLVQNIQDLHDQLTSHEHDRRAGDRA